MADSSPGRKSGFAAAALPSVLIVAAALRLLGLTWGLPGETHLFSYHPDEYFSLQAAFGLANGDPNPHFFRYPSLYLYLAAAAGSLPGHVAALGAAGPDDFPRLLRLLTLDARLMTVLLALATVGAVYAAAGRLAGRAAGLCAAAALAVAPGHVLYSHFAAVDVPLALLTTLSLYAAWVLSEDERWKTAALGGLAVAAAAATKYNGALAIVMPWAAFLVRASQSWRARGGRAALQAALLLLVVVVGFFVLSPYVALDPGAARHDINAEREHMRVGEPTPKAADPNGWLFQLRALGYSTGGSVVLAAYLALTGWALYRHWPRSAPLALFAVLWFALIGATGVRYARYGLPLSPLLAIGAGVGAAELFRSGRRGLGIAAAATALLPPLFTSLLLSGSMAFEPEPRDAALAGLQAKASPGTMVGLVRTVWFDMPPLDYDNGGDALGGMWRQFRRSPYRLQVIGLGDAALDRQQPPWFVETDFQLADELRAQRPPAVQLRAALDRGYVLDEVFQRRWGWRLLGPCGPPPHDWSYPFTTVRLWRLNRPR